MKLVNNATKFLALTISLLIIQTTTASADFHRSNDISGIKVLGKFGNAPKVSGIKGLPPKSLIQKDIIEGSGLEINPDSTFIASYSLYSWKKKKLVESNWNADGFEISLTETIKGWQKGLLGLKEGGRRLLVIPPSLGYGKNPNGPIPANDTLIFVVDLLSIVEIDSAIDSEPEEEIPVEAPIVNTPKAFLNPPLITGVDLFDGEFLITFNLPQPPMGYVLTNLQFFFTANSGRSFTFATSNVKKLEPNDDGSITYSYRTTPENIRRSLGYTGNAPTIQIRVLVFAYPSLSSKESLPWSVDLSSYDEFNF